jgi:hypothetical protein
MPRLLSFLIAALGAAVLLIAASTPALAQTRPAHFGQRWVRSHPLTLMGLQQWPHTLDIHQHHETNMTSMLVWWADGNGKQTAAISSNDGFPWHALIVDGEGDERDRITDYASVGHSAGWMIGDELARSQLPFFGDIVAWTKQNRPNDLVYTNAYPTYAGDDTRYGGTPPPGGYSYSQYLEDIVQVLKPDVLMYDHYPYVENLMRHDYFYNLMLVRDKAQEHNLPYFAFMQSSALGAYRLPSKSDARMQMFSHLAAGYTGISYFTFDSEPSFQYAAILDNAGNPTSLYPIVADINREAANLGQALRLMKSDGVRYIPGRHVAGGTIVPNDVPLGMTKWTAADDSDEHLQNITIATSGLGQDGMIGFFTDDASDAAFMLVNVHHSATLSQFATLRFTLVFDATVTSLLRLDRITGQQVVVPLTNNRLTIDIPAGTGELFKYNEGDFILSVPEPGSLALLFSICAASALFTSRRRACD